MPAALRPRNRGPAAAAENRAAILAAARQLFAEQGYRVPLSAIAREASVGQGVLYRHFPDRLALAVAVFEDNFAELEQLAASTSGPECFPLLWRRLVAYTVDSSAFVEMVIDARTQLPADASEDRLLALMAEPLARAQDAGLADPDWTPQDILLLEQMVYGVAIAQPDPALVTDAVRRALALIDPRLADVG
jgi:AcrR family transcriptional regulator